MRKREKEGCEKSARKGRFVGMAQRAVALGEHPDARSFESWSPLARCPARCEAPDVEDRCMPIGYAFDSGRGLRRDGLVVIDVPRRRIGGTEGRRRSGSRP